MISDYYYPLIRDRSKSIVWSTIGGISQVTETSPIIRVLLVQHRIHPAIKAHVAVAAAFILLVELYLVLDLVKI